MNLRQNLSSPQVNPFLRKKPATPVLNRSFVVLKKIDNKSKNFDSEISHQLAQISELITQKCEKLSQINAIKRLRIRYLSEQSAVQTLVLSFLPSIPQKVAEIAEELRQILVPSLSQMDPLTKTTLLLLQLVQDSKGQAAKLDRKSELLQQILRVKANIFVLIKQKKCGFEHKNQSLEQQIAVFQEIGELSGFAHLFREISVYMQSFKAKLNKLKEFEPFPEFLLPCLADTQKLLLSTAFQGSSVCQEFTDAVPAFCIGNCAQNLDKEQFIMAYYLLGKQRLGELIASGDISLLAAEIFVAAKGDQRRILIKITQHTLYINQFLNKYNSQQVFDEEYILTNLPQVLAATCSIMISLDSIYQFLGILYDNCKVYEQFLEINPEITHVRSVSANFNEYQEKLYSNEFDRNQILFLVDVLNIMTYDGVFNVVQQILQRIGYDEIRNVNKQLNQLQITFKLLKNDAQVQNYQTSKDICFNLAELCGRRQSEVLACLGIKTYKDAFYYYVQQKIKRPSISNLADLI